MLIYPKNINKNNEHKENLQSEIISILFRDLIRDLRDLILTSYLSIKFEIEELPFLFSTIKKGVVLRGKGLSNAKSN